MPDITDEVKKYILRKVLPGEDPGALTPTTPLISSGILNSVEVLLLGNFLEQRFGIELEIHEFDDDHLGSLERIARLVRAKSGSGAR